VSPPDVTEIAARLMAAITAGDVDAVGALYREDMVGWMNTDRRELSRRQMLKIIGFLQGVSNLRYEDVRVQPTPTGYVQQHVLRATAADGREVASPACLVVTLEGGLIVRLDEYMDGAALAPLLEQA
jgi:ketosteroid isomerase-like protein